MSLIQVVVGGASKDLYVMMLEKAYSELNERFSYDIFPQKEKNMLVCLGEGFPKN